MSFAAAQHGEPPITAHVQQARAVHLRLFDERDEEIRRVDQHRAVKARRRDPDDRERVSIQLDRAADDAAVAEEVRAPVRVREHNVRRAARSALVRSMEEAAQIRAEGRARRSSCRSPRTPRLAWDSRRLHRGVEPRLIGVKAGESVEAASAIAEIYIVRVRLARQVIAGALDREERLFVRQTERAKNEAVDGAEHDRVRAYRDSKRDDGRDGEARRFPELAYAEAEIADERLEQTRRRMHRAPLP